MKSYRKTLTRRKRRVPEQIPNGYWQAYRSLYGHPQSDKPSPASEGLDEIDFSENAFDGERNE